MTYSHRSENQSCYGWRPLSTCSALIILMIIRRAFWSASTQIRHDHDPYWHRQQRCPPPPLLAAAHSLPPRAPRPPPRRLLLLLPVGLQVYLQVGTMHLEPKCTHQEINQETRHPHVQQGWRRSHEHRTRKRRPRIVGWRHSRRYHASPRRRGWPSSTVSMASRRVLERL